MPALKNLAASLVMLILATFCPAAQAADDDAVKEGLKQLEGKWKVTSCLKDGEELEAVINLGVQFSFKGDALDVTGREPSFTPQQRVIRIDVSTKPKLLDVAEKTEEFKGGDKVIEGLYALDGDTLKWCFAMEGDQPAKGKRPAALESKAGDGVLLFTLKRVKE